MAKDLDGLVINRMFKELEFCKSDYEYTNELVNFSDTEFLKSVNDCLSEYPDLKEAFESSMAKEFLAPEVSLEDSTVDDDTNIDDDSHIVDYPSQKLKKLYREIVKKTHPDKVSDRLLNDLYVTATSYYDLRDILSIYSVCGDLKIPFEIDSSDLDLIKESIKDFRSKICFIQSTYTWRWSNSDDGVLKKKLVLEFIGAQIKR
jgi:hypothetical protein